MFKHGALLPACGAGVISGGANGRGDGMSPKQVPAKKPAAAIDWKGVKLRKSEAAAGDTIFAQGDEAASVMYLERGTVRLSVMSHAGKEAVIAVLDDGY